MGLGALLSLASIVVLTASCVVAINRRRRGATNVIIDVVGWYG